LGDAALVPVLLLAAARLLPLLMVRIWFSKASKAAKEEIWGALAAGSPPEKPPLVQWRLLALRPAAAASPTQVDSFTISLPNHSAMTPTVLGTLLKAVQK
jgi:hypothetical protein